jgi:glutamate-1-semialdehyde 2,1-aminomutase
LPKRCRVVTELPHDGSTVHSGSGAGRKGKQNGMNPELTQAPRTRITERTQSQLATLRLEQLVPGGAHTYAKGADQYPEGMAPVIARGDGATVWDVDGNRYLELGAGLRSVSLGHRHTRVDRAVRQALDLGANFVRPTIVELRAAEKLLSVVPSADMVKFAKNGSDATSAAVRLARSITGRDHVALCFDQPFFSADDWFIGVSAMPAGVPEATRRLSLTFSFNDLEGLRRLLSENAVACVVLEGMTPALQPEPSFLEGVRALCTEFGALMVLDEMINGFRVATAGSQELFGIAPDLATFGKALGNGFAVSALVGRREYMEHGGFDRGHERVFLLSTTHGAETHALAAAMAVIDTYQEESVVEQLGMLGRRLAAGVEQASAAAGVSDHIRVFGHPANLVFATLDDQGRPSQPYRTLFLQGMLDRGVIAPSLVVSAALTEDDVDQIADAAYEACTVYRRALDHGISTELRGRPVRPALRTRD